MLADWTKEQSTLTLVGVCEGFAVGIQELGAEERMVLLSNELILDSRRPGLNLALHFVM